MKGKVFTFLGVIIMILVVASYFLFEAFVKDNSNVNAQNIIVAKQPIKEGTVVHNADEASQLFEVKRISSSNIVDGAVIVDNGDFGDAGFIAVIQKKFSSNTASNDSVNQLIGYKVTRNYAKNEQILATELSTDTIEFNTNERLYAIETSYVNSVAAEIKVGDYIDLWLVESTDGITTSQKLIGPLKIYKLKTSDNVNIADGSTAIPSIVIFKLDEETIEYISTKKNEGTIFFTKYGTTPTQDDIDAALEDAQKKDAERQEAEKQAEEDIVIVEKDVTTTTVDTSASESTVDDTTNADATTNENATTDSTDVNK